MSNRRKSGFTRPVTVDEVFRIGVDLSVTNFLQEDETELEFPSSFTSDERAYVHRIAVLKGLKSKSRGKGSNRYITLYKKDGSTIMQSEARVALSADSKKIAENILNQCPVTNKEKFDLLPQTDRERNFATTNESKTFFIREDKCEARIRNEFSSKN